MRSLAARAPLWPLLLAALVLLQAPCIAGQPTPGAPGDAPSSPDPRLRNPVVPGSLFVRFQSGKPGAGPAATAAVAAGAVGALRLPGGTVGGTVRLAPGESIKQAAARLRAAPGVASVSPDLWVRTAQAGGCQDVGPVPHRYCAPPDGALSWGLERISAGYAWGRGVVGRGNTGICLIDSGVDCGHPDLQRPDGRSVCAEGVRFREGVQTPGLEAAADEAGHGTRLAGVIAAAGDGAGAVGVMQAGAALYVCRFIDADGWGRISDALRCLHWCLGKNVAVSVNAYGVNIGGVSWEDWSDGLGSPAGVLADLGATLEQAGARHLFVAAAGNAGERLREQPEGPPPPGPPTPGVPPPFFWMPAQLHADNMLVVAASDPDDGLWSVSGPAGAAAPPEGPPRGSNYGSNWVDLAAPGADIYAPRRRGPAERAPGARPVANVSGTSVSTAFVGGVAGLILAAQNFAGVEPGLDMGHVRHAILDGADELASLEVELPDGQELVHDGRRLNAYNALAAYFGPEDFPPLPPGLAGQRPVRDAPAPPPPPPSPPPPARPRSPPPPVRPPLKSPPPPVKPPVRPSPPPPRPVPPRNCGLGAFLDVTGVCRSCPSKWGALCVQCTRNVCQVRRAAPGPPPILRRDALPTR